MGDGATAWQGLSDARLATELALVTGRYLQDLRDNGHRHSDDATLQAVGDLGAHELIAAALLAARPDDVLLSEEGPDDGRRLGASRVWIVDPVDGTRDYGARRPEWAVHIALWQDGELVAGAVSLPDRDAVFSTDPPTQVPVPAPASGSRLRLAVSRSREAGLVARVVDALGARPLPLGSAGYKTGVILLGEADAYLHAGGQYEWDSAAPVAVARAAGLHTSRIDGSPLEYNRASLYLPDLLICRPDDAAGVLDAVERARRRS